MLLACPARGQASHAGFAGMTAYAEKVRRFAAAHPFSLCVALIWALLLWAYLPGTLNADSADMLSQAVSGRYHDWHSTLMSLVWRALNLILPGPPLMLILVQGAFFGGACFLITRLSQRWTARLACFCALVFWPPIFNDLGLVTKDSFFLSTLALFIAALLGAILAPAVSRRHVALLILASLVGTAVRNDGALIFLPCLALAYALALGRRRRWALVYAAVLALGTVVASYGLMLAFNAHVLHATPRFNIQTTLTHDLAAISIKAGTNVMPEYLVQKGVDMDWLRAKYSPRGQDQMGLPIAEVPPEFQQLRLAWEQAVWRYPGFYLQHRLATFGYLLDIEPAEPVQLWQFAPEPHAEQWYPAVRGMHAMGPYNRFLVFLRDKVMPPLLATPIYRGWFYELAILLGMALATRRLMLCRTPNERVDMLILALSTGTLLRDGALFFLSPEATLRYLFPTILCCVIMALLSAWQYGFTGAGRQGLAAAPGEAPT